MEPNDINSGYYFKNLLTNSDYKKLNFEEQKKLLIEKHIYTELDYSFGATEIIYGLGRSCPFPYIDEKDFKIGNWFNYGCKLFEINPVFVRELYDHVRQSVMSQTDQLLTIELEEINLHAKHLNNFSNANKYYQKKYKKSYKKILLNSEFLMYSNPEAYYYPSWEWYISEVLVLDEDSIEKYLFTEYPNNLFRDISKPWQDLHFHSTIIKYLTEKIEESKKTTNTPLSKEIFKDDGEEIFKFLEENYTGKKIPAFYSYLFYFLRDFLKKIKIEDDDSTLYKKYIIQNRYLKKYGRMQKPKSTSQKKYNEMMVLFREISSQKFEENMSKNE